MIPKDAEKPVDGRMKQGTNRRRIMEFNEKLQQLRTGKNLTQEQLAEHYMYQEQPFQNGKAARVTLTLSRSSVFLNSFL